MKISIVFILLMGISSLSAAAPSSRFQVGVEVSASDPLKGRLESFVTRELRSLNDVSIELDPTHYVIQLVALETHTNVYNDTGIAISIVILEPFHNDLIWPIDSINDHEKEYINSITSDLDYVYAHWLRSGSLSELRSIAEGIVADFDSQYLQANRNREDSPLTKAIKELID